MIITVCIEYEKKLYEMFISYENYSWKLINAGEIERLLPLSLDYDLVLKDSESTIDLKYKKVTPKMKDYVWILLMKILEDELENFSIREEQEKNAEIALRDFFNALLTELGSYSTSSEDVTVNLT